MKPPRLRKATLTSNDVVAPSVHAIRFSLPDDEHLEFEPGQYVSISFRHDGKEITRPYSIASSARRQDGFTLLVKRVRGGLVSTYLCGLVPWERPVVRALAPLGRFMVENPGSHRVVMVATGTGLAPFVPMVEHLWLDLPETPTWLIFRAKTSGDLFYLKELRSLERAWPRFHFVPTVDGLSPGDSWSGQFGHVGEVIARMFPTLNGTDVYLAGNSGEINRTEDIVAGLGCPPEQIHTERYGEEDALA